MQAEGLQSLFPMEELSVMGVAEILPRIPALLSRIRQTARAVAGRSPDVFVSIDAPDFSFRVAALLKKDTSTRHIPRVHYVAPTVWAWRAGRAQKIAALYHHLMCLLPFEPRYFLEAGLSASFVGHPLVEQGALLGQGGYSRNMQPTLVLLPGSRRSEIKRHLSLFLEASQCIAQYDFNARRVIVTLPHLRRQVEEIAREQAIEVITDRQQGLAEMRAARGALAVSGTVGLELAIMGVPHVIAYKANPISIAIAKHMVKVEHIHLANLLADFGYLDRWHDEIVPEMIQEKVNNANIELCLRRLWTDSVWRSKQAAAFSTVAAALKSDDKNPSARTAEEILAAASRR